MNNKQNNERYIENNEKQRTTKKHNENKNKQIKTIKTMKNT